MIFNIRLRLTRRLICIGSLLSLNILMSFLHGASFFVFDTSGREERSLDFYATSFYVIMKQLLDR